MKGLVLYNEFCQDYHERIKQDSLEYLKAIDPRLPHLKCVYWQLSLVPNDLEIFTLFQRECPNLDSVYLLVYNSIDEPYNTGELLARLGKVTNIMCTRRPVQGVSSFFWRNV